MIKQLKNYWRHRKNWGRFIQYVLNEPTTVKIVAVKNGWQTSLHAHQHRAECWVALDRGLVITVGQRQLRPVIGGEVFVPARVKHRLAFRGRGEGRILEIGLGRWSEQDIVRYDRNYHGGAKPRR